MGFERYLQAGKNNVRRSSEATEVKEAVVGTENIANVLTAHAVFSIVSNPKTGVEMKVVDPVALRAAIKSIFERAQLLRTPNYKQKLFTALPYALGHDPVLTRSQVEAGDFSEKPFFYIPESVDAATEMLSIKNAEFHAFVNDFVPLVRGEAPTYPTHDAGAAESISALEVKAAALIFNPRYGDGFRDERGQLFMRSHLDRKYVRFSGDVLKSYGVRNGEFRFPEGSRIANTPERPRSVREGVAAELPHLVEKGLIRPVEDFKQITYGSGIATGQRIDRAGVDPSGARMFRGVKHYIGKQFYGKPVRIVEISPGIGAVVDKSGGAERVTHTFSIVPREFAKQDISGMYLANAPITQTRPFSAESIALPRRNDESLEQYRDRTEKTDRGLAHLLLHVFSQYPELSKMLRDKPSYEQASIAQAAYLLERDNQTGRFDEFIQEHGALGARTFLVTANNEQLLEKTFAFAQSASKGQSEKVFTACSKLIDTIDTLYTYLREQFGTASSKAISEISTTRLKRVESTLSSAYDNPEQLLARIENANTENAFFLDAYRAVKSENPGLKLEEIPAIGLDIMGGVELLENAVLLESVEKIYRENWSPERGFAPGDADAMIARFRAALADPATKFYLLSHQPNDQRNPIAFMLTTENKDSVYVGALNVDKEFVGARPGRVLLDKVYAMGKAGKTVEAIAVPDTARAYLAQFNGVADGVVRVPDGPTFLHITGSKQLNDALQSRVPSVARAGELARSASETFDPSKRLQVLKAKSKADLVGSLEAPFAAGFVATQLIPRDGTIFAVIEKPQTETPRSLAA